MSRTSSADFVAGRIMCGRVDEALTVVKRVLDATRRPAYVMSPMVSPSFSVLYIFLALCGTVLTFPGCCTRYPQNTPHRYQDKYRLAEALTQSAFTVQLQALGAVGLTAQHIEQFHQWAVNQNEIVTLRFTSSQSCMCLTHVVCSMSRCLSMMVVTCACPPCLENFHFATSNLCTTYTPQRASLHTA